MEERKMKLQKDGIEINMFRQDTTFYELKYKNKEGKILTKELEASHLDRRKLSDWDGLGDSGQAIIIRSIKSIGGELAKYLPVLEKK